MLLKTQSWFPSCVKNFIAQPRTSLSVSTEPRSRATVESRSITGVVVPTPLRNLADVISEMSWVTSNAPKAPAALACTTLPSQAGQASLQFATSHESCWGCTFQVSSPWQNGPTSRLVACLGGVAGHRHLSSIVWMMMGSPEDSLDIISYRKNDVPDFVPSASVYMGVVLLWLVSVSVKLQGYSKNTWTPILNLQRCGCDVLSGRATNALLYPSVLVSQTR